MVFTRNPYQEGFLAGRSNDEFTQPLDLREPRVPSPSLHFTSLVAFPRHAVSQCPPDR